MDPQAEVPRRILLELIVQSKQSQGVDEALELLGTLGGDSNNTTDYKRRMRAQLLALRGTSADLAEAVNLLRTMLAPTAQDEALLVSLHERNGRIGPAFNLLSQIVAAHPQEGQFTEQFLAFWQEHFLRRAEAGDRPQFASLSEDAYRRLIAKPAQQSDWLRHKIRGIRAETGLERVRWDQVSPLVGDAINAIGRFEEWESATQLRWCESIFRVLLQERIDGGCVALIHDPRLALASSDRAVAFCHAIIFSSLNDDQVEQAMLTLNTLATVFPENAEFARANGDVLFLAAQYEKAIRAYERALELDPLDKLTSNNLALALAEKPGGLIRARTVLGQAIQEHGRDPVLEDTRAVLSLVEGRPADALSIVNDAFRLTSEDPMTSFRASMAHYRLGEIQEATQAFLDALVMGIDRGLLSPSDRDFFDWMRATVLQLPIDSQAEHSRRWPTLTSTHKSRAPTR